MNRPASLAEYYRAHRAAMELALATGCTPKEAEAELRRQARARRLVCGTHAPAPVARDEFEQMDRPPNDFREFGAAWMMRD